MFNAESITKFKTEKRLPLGRVQEYIVTLTEEQKQRTATKMGQRLGDDETIKTFKTRQAMARLIRKEEKDAPHSKWRPVVKLTDGEGF
jgi:hypothetical protein